MGFTANSVKPPLMGTIRKLTSGGRRLQSGVFSMMMRFILVVDDDKCCICYRNDGLTGKRFVRPFDMSQATEFDETCRIVVRRCANSIFHCVVTPRLKRCTTEFLKRAKGGMSIMEKGGCGCGNAFSRN